MGEIRGELKRATIFILYITLWFLFWALAFVCMWSLAICSVVVVKALFVGYNMLAMKCGVLGLLSWFYLEWHDSAFPSRDPREPSRKETDILEPDILQRWFYN